MQKSIIRFLTSCLLVINFSILPAHSATKLPILDGTMVPATDFPYVGLVTVGDFICTGTLVSPRFVLSAGHCFFDDNHQKITDLSAVTVTLDNHVFPVANVTVHPNYVSRDDACIEGETDASLIELQTAATGVTPIALKRTAPTVGEELLIVGFGTQGTGQSGEDVTFPDDGYVNYGQTEIESVDSTYVNWNFDANAGESNTGGGDSGGPAFVDIGGTRYIDSITCGGTDNSGFNSSSSNTRADRIATWVDSITGNAAPRSPAAALGVDSVVVNMVDDNAYALVIKGKLAAPRNFAPNKVAVKVQTDRSATSFRLDKNGAWSNKRGFDFFKFSGRLSGGKFTSTPVGYTAALGDVSSVFNNLNRLFPDRSKNGAIVQFPIQFTVNNVVYKKTVKMVFNSRSGVWKSSR